MTLYPLANALYPEQYSVTLDQKFLHTFEVVRYKTHTSICAERLHQISEILLKPWSWNVQFLGHLFQPLPGENKERYLWGLTIQVSCLFLWLITIPFAMVSLTLAFPLRCIDHCYRPAIGYMDNSGFAQAKVKTQEELILSKESPLHIRTHNVGFVPTFISITGDLRHPAIRAKELVESILHDPCKPDIIFFQETFHEDATQILCEGIKEEYPYIIHNVAPQISGLNSGSMVASKYPIENVQFERFEHMLGPELLSPRGIIKIGLKSIKGPVILYGCHTQAIIGEDRATARFHQLEQIKKCMEADAVEEPHVIQILVGDFNTSRVSAWGEDNLIPSGQAEERVLKRFNDYFEDFYLKDHCPLTGRRVQGESFYLQVDNKRLQEDLIEPSGSWYHGPFADPGIIFEAKSSFDRWLHDRPTPQKVEEIEMQKSNWGSANWRKQQSANTARFDYILIPKEQTVKLDGRVEIRRVIVPADAQSASTDHLPVDGRIWLS